MQFIAPLAFLGLLIAIPIILLYMLRLRREEVVVSSNFLWQQVLEDKEANTPWQRLRRNLLLFLQLLILALLVLALTRPAQVVPTISAGRTVILLDASASMNATDGGDSRTRFEAAQEQAQLLVSELGVEDEMSIIRVADVATPLVEYTGNFTALRNAINTAQPGTGDGDWNTALTLAAAGAEGVDDFRIFVISDGGLDDVAALPENIPAPVYVPVGTAGDNIALTALATRTRAGEDPQLFAQVENFTPDDAAVSLVIRLDGELWESARQTISAGSQRSFIFTVDQAFNTVEAEVIIGEGVIDHLPDDNRAWTVAGDASTRRVLLASSSGNVFIEQVLRSIPGVQTFRADTNRATLPRDPYDLYLFDNWLPATLPEADMLIINPPANTPLFTVADGEPVTGGRLQVTAPDHPLMTFVDLSDTNLSRFRPVTPVGGWATPLATTNDTPVLWAGELANQQVAVLSFNLRDSDLPLKIAWPVLMSNLFDWASPADIIRGSESLTVGDALTIAPPAGTTDVRITRPDGTTERLTLTGDLLTYTDTIQTGLYALTLTDSDGATREQPFVVNLFGTGESDIAPRTAGQISLGGGAIETDAEEQPTLREFWPLLALFGLMILMIEWWLYYRRIGGIPKIRRHEGDLRAGLRLSDRDQRRTERARMNR